MKPVGPGVWGTLNITQIFGSNTGVGKTLISTLLCKTLLKKHPNANVRYLKPVSTGPSWEADDFHIRQFFRDEPRLSYNTLFQFGEPMSPHLAAIRDNKPTSDGQVLSKLSQELDQYAKASKESHVVIESAGGVLSPTPSGSLQADAYRPFRFPTILVGDGQLGGIGNTIAAYESLLVRGYDLDAVVLFDDGKMGNTGYLEEHFQGYNIPLISLKPPPEKPVSHEGPAAEQDKRDMAVFYDLTSSQKSMTSLVDILQQRRKVRSEALESLAARTEKSIWHPFMQHKFRDAKSILPIDSAYGDFFLTKPHAATPNTTLVPAFDGSASWWTQGLGHGNPDLAFTAAYAAGRYGHVMFASATHEPAVRIAEMLLEGMKNPRLAKVFFSDNGSTGIEVAIKMGLRAATKHYGWDSSSEEIGIIGLQGSYHGDTIGAMDCSEPSTYNKKVDWYCGRGLWFDFPKVKMSKGKWVIEPPVDMEKEFGPAQTFSSLAEVFDLSRNSERYEDFIQTILEREVKEKGRKFGAVILEPVILGAGGMLFSDPLFQHALVKVVRRSDFGTEKTPLISSEASNDDSSAWTGLPIIHDEVFTGLYRLGRFSSSSFIGVHPDITVHAKLLTGGLIPLCLTTASEHIFNAFLSDEKSDALLHGHSYTAHAVGCEVACKSLGMMNKMDEEGKWSGFKAAWQGQPCSPTSNSTAGSSSGSGGSQPWSMWSSGFVSTLSFKDSVEGVFSLGSVLAVALKDPSGTGYNSNAASRVRERLATDVHGNGWIVHSRVLGNVIYLMASMTSERETLAKLEEAVLEAV